MVFMHSKIVPVKIYRAVSQYTDYRPKLIKSAGFQKKHRVNFFKVQGSGIVMALSRELKALC